MVHSLHPSPQHPSLVGQCWGPPECHRCHRVLGCSPAHQPCVPGGSEGFRSTQVFRFVCSQGAMSAFASLPPSSQPPPCPSLHPAQLLSASTHHIQPVLAQHPCCTCSIVSPKPRRAAAAPRSLHSHQSKPAPSCPVPAASLPAS